MIYEIPYTESAYALYLGAWELVPFLLIILVGAALLNRALVHFVPNWSKNHRDGHR